MPRLLRGACWDTCLIRRTGLGVFGGLKILGIDGGSPSADVDPYEVTCRELGLDNPSAPGGEQLKSDQEKLDVVTDRITEDVNARTASRKAVEAQVFLGLGLYCVKSENLDFRPGPDVLREVRTNPGALEGDRSPRTPAPRGRTPTG